ncbi:mandelate racemase/muconate lactonizing enzyme family protein [Roseomonas sp. OT10]|uniref:mandelate racemase/muconate lactonizing enzyme family protein n=1 Tax=Roseomonas cutis TaxID=2897332 RepID=UPI001E48BF58|nr:mandelate racemase/muconate lactonizing enzyme family protein [Roseomonas sp. OT10]UFN48280.1 mandelate racemase/muconate lactonizing enzyme family protein [Roseomonas sp. OT10]
MAQGSRIATVELFELTIPFADGGAGLGLTPDRWDRFETVLLRLTDEAGRQGWGEAFSYACRGAVSAAVREMVAPLLLGQDAADPPAVTEMLQRKLHLFGRYGITLFALSGADIALWDLKARVAGVPLAALLGPRRREAVAAYASLVRYGDPALVERFAACAVAEGYRSVKLHEVTEATIAAGRSGAGPGTHLTVDVNCAWTVAEARARLPFLAAQGITWLEEPVFPPEDATGLAALRAAGPVAVAAGENACTRWQFAQMIAAGAVTFPQPSVTKLGGVTEFLAVLEAAERAGLTCMPHSPYFGPGYFATLQLLAVAPGEPLLEVLYVEPEGYPGLGTPLPRDGMVAIPTGPGIGFAPDPAVFERHVTARWSSAAG